MIYFLLDEPRAAVKIGFSTDVVSRFEQHRTTNPFLQFVLAVQVPDKGWESTLHRIFDEERIDREWFKLSERLAAYIEWLGTRDFIAGSIDEACDPSGHYFEERCLPEHMDNSTPLAVLPFASRHGGLRFPLGVEDRRSLYVRSSNEWYTPSFVIEAARDCMGSIDLDPASNPHAQRRIRAGRFYSKSHDGLADHNPWFGNVWLNPPYGGEQNGFLDRLVREYAAGNIDQAILCVNGYTYDTQWFQPLWSQTLCFSSRRIAFEGGPVDRAHKGNNQPLNGTVFAYFGAHVDRFVHSFRDIGAIVRDLRGAL